MGLSVNIFMGKHLFRKPEPTDVRGTCVRCETRPQKSKGKGKFAALCRTCETQLYNEKPNLRGNWRRFWLRKQRKSVCEHCGFVPVHHCQLDVDHIDGDRMNNSTANLQTLCANCHRLKTFLNKDWAKSYPLGPSKWRLFRHGEETEKDQVQNRHGIHDDK